MRWMWIDTIVAYEPDRRLVAIKNVSLAEEHLHQHFAAEGDLPAQPVMPASLMIEGMAQTAGILAGSVRGFREKVVLAKIQKAEITADVVPGQCIRYDARLERIDPMGAGTAGTIERLDHRTGTWERIGETEIMFSHVDQNMSGLAFPEHNFVFSDSFRNVLQASGLGHLMK
ncbi:MAG: beta-hydroxyacyl-ACP dehydratase [Phycisphaerales bacterium]|nr:beta-hydroxyacyl-ACP dehydratase [Phycisphaerales bacterium]